MESKGYIPINRKLFEHDLWRKKRVFSTFEAWIDLIQQAKFEDTTEHLRGAIVTIGRGQVVSTIRELSERWKWSTTKVLKFLEMLLKNYMIKKDTLKETGQTLITLCKYETYNSTSAEKKQQKKQKKNKEKTEKKQKKNTIIGINNLNNSNNINIPPTPLTGNVSKKNPDVEASASELPPPAGLPPTEAEGAKKPKAEKPKCAARVFTPPTVEEVSAYCTERKNGIDPVAFVDFYQSRGWMYGNTKIRDWKACVRTWEQRNKTFKNQNYGAKQSGRSYMLDLPQNPNYRTEM
jgi:hypothetical protein